MDKPVVELNVPPLVKPIAVNMGVDLPALEHTGEV